MILQGQPGREQKCIRGGRTASRIISPAPAFQRESQSMIERARRPIVFGHIEEQGLGAFAKGFRRGMEYERARKAGAARVRRRCKRYDLRFVRGGLNQDECLQLSLSRIVSNEGDRGPLQQAAKRFRIPAFIEAAAVNACQIGCIRNGRGADDGSHVVAPGSFASGARK